MLMFTGSTFLFAQSSQTPQHHNFNVTELGNNFPFNQPSGKRIQVLYRPGEFSRPTPSPSGDIVSVSFKLIVPLGPYTYSDFTIRLGQTDITDFTSGIWYSGQMDTVFYRPSITLSSNSLWMTFNLDRTFNYDSSRSLVMDIQHCGAPGASGFSSSVTNTFGVRRNTSSAGTMCPFVFGESTGIVHLFGITLGPATSILNSTSEIPDSYSLSQNFPNPFNPVTTINYSIPVSGLVNLKVFNILGKKVSSLVNDFKQPGNYSVDFDASDLTSGIYFYKISAGDFSEIKKMTLIK
ncbi:MAG: T9SS type A sorting domain-containing protein [Bacteroidetes bacterium]|nr:T9SS type A sorting domain-containing protein [Bacteroidota bacterium]